MSDNPFYRLPSLESAAGRCGIQDGEQLLLWDVLWSHLRRPKLINFSHDEEFKFSVDDGEQIIHCAEEFIYVTNDEQLTRSTINGDRVIVWNVDDEFAEQKCRAVKVSDDRLFVLTSGYSDGTKSIMLYTFDDMTGQARIGRWTREDMGLADLTVLNNLSFGCCMTALSDGSVVISTLDRVLQWDPRNPTEWIVVRACVCVCVYEVVDVYCVSVCVCVYVRACVCVCVSR